MTKKDGKAEANGGLVVVPLEQLRELIREELDRAQAERAQEAPARLTLTQLATKLQISERSILDLRRRGMPTAMLGDSPRFDLAKVLAWLDGAETATNEFRQAEAGGGWERKMANGEWRAATELDLAELRKLTATLGQS
jgi:hypothetical protein